MPIELRELQVRVTVGPAEVPPATVPEPVLEAIKREIMDACLSELRRHHVDPNER